jgi:hypothetical protein
MIRAACKTSGLLALALPSSSRLQHIKRSLHSHSNSSQAASAMLHKARLMQDQQARTSTEEPTDP